MSKQADIIAARIVAAFARTKLEPVSGKRGVTINDQSRTFCSACAVGAVAIDRKRGVASAAFGDRTFCVEAGWDDVFDGNVHSFNMEVCPGCHCTECDFYEAGATAAVAMGA